ncbi:MAG: hypothetical protein IPG23_16005 [Burkholderiales bacterium]|nr:hypothetical protein [Burkholderiales bacterium]
MNLRQYFRGKQSGSVNGTSNGNVTMSPWQIYAFSKRTDAYFGVDHTSISGGTAVVLDTAAALAAVPVSPLVFVTASNHWWGKRRSGNRVAQVSRKPGRQR